MKTDEIPAISKFRFSSSIADDVWHPNDDPRAYEWWYFDALSDDGRDAVVIIFLDNFVFSPRYNRRDSSEVRSRIPAVAFFYYRDGQVLCRAINEFQPDDFEASTVKPECRIGDNSIEFKSAPYGSGFMISISSMTHRGFAIDASFEWLTVEGDFSPRDPVDGAHHWNLVVPRADVSGRVVVNGTSDEPVRTLHFRGTGYHDHNYDTRWLPETVHDWHWGRAHFNDATAVFYRYTECGSSEESCVTKLLTIRDGLLSESDAGFAESDTKRDIFGIRFPQRMTFHAANGTKLKVSHLETIDSSFFYLRFLSEMTLTQPDCAPHTAVGITEFLSPKTLKYRWLDWLVDMRIGRRGKGARIP